MQTTEGTLTSYKTDFKANVVTRDREGYALRYKVRPSGRNTK